MREILRLRLFFVVFVIRINRKTKLPRTEIKINVWTLSVSLSTGYRELATPASIQALGYPANTAAYVIKSQSSALNGTRARLLY